MVCCLLSEWYVTTSFYQSSANHVSFCFCETYSTLSDCGQDAQSDQRPREQESSPAEGQSCGGGTTRYEAERGRKEGRRWH